MMLNKRHCLYNNRRINFTVRGKGNAIVLLHGFLENLNIWDETSSRLSENYKVVCIDLPGHGNSDSVAEVNTMEIMADVVKYVLEYINVDKALIVGHSMGGYVAMAFLSKYAPMVSGIGLFHSHFAADSAETKINRGRAIKIVRDKHKDFISAFIPELFTEENRNIYKDRILVLQDESRLMSAESVIAAIEGMRQRSDMSKIVKNSDIPFMFIIGYQDPRTPMEMMSEQICLAKHNEVLILKDVAHMGFIEAYEKCVCFIEHFADSCYRGI